MIKHHCRRLLSALIWTVAANFATAGTLGLVPSFSPASVGEATCGTNPNLTVTLTVGYTCSGSTCAAPTITVSLPPGMSGGTMVGDSMTTAKSSNGYGNPTQNDVFNQSTLANGWTSQVQIQGIGVAGPLYNYPHSLSIPVTITSSDSTTVTQNLSLPITAMACTPTLYVTDYVNTANRNVAMGDSIPWSANTGSSTGSTGMFYPPNFDDRAIVGPGTLTMVLPPGASATPGKLCYADWLAVTNHPLGYAVTPTCDAHTSMTGNNSTSPVVITWTLPAGKVAYPNLTQTGFAGGPRYANADVVFPSNAVNTSGKIVRACSNWAGYTWGGTDTTYAPTADGLTPVTVGTQWDGTSTPGASNQCSVPLTLQTPIVKPVATKTGSNDNTPYPFTLHTGTAALTDAIAFSLGVNNQGNTTLQNVVLQDDLPTWFKFTGFSGFPGSGAGDPTTTVSPAPTQAFLYQTNLSAAADSSLWYTLPAASYAKVCAALSAFSGTNTLCGPTEYVTRIRVVTSRDLLPGFSLGIGATSSDPPTLTLAVTPTNSYYISGVVLQTGWDGAPITAPTTLYNSSTATAYTNSAGNVSAITTPAYQLAITAPHPAISAATDRSGVLSYSAGNTDPYCAAGFSTSYGGVPVQNSNNETIGGGMVTGSFTISSSFPDFLLPNGPDGNYVISVNEGWQLLNSVDPACPSKTLIEGTDYTKPVVTPNYMGTGRTLVTTTLLPDTLSLPSGTMVVGKSYSQCSVGMTVSGMKVATNAIAGNFTCQAGVISAPYYPDANASISSPVGTGLKQFADGSITLDYGLGTAAFDWNNDGTTTGEQVHWASRSNTILATPSASLNKAFDGSSPKIAGTVVNYTLTLANTGNDYLTSFDIVDVLPASTDGRTSTAALAITGALSAGTLPSGASLTISYATATNPCRPGVTSGCTTPTWLAAGAVSDWSTIHAFRLQGTSFNILPFSGTWAFSFPLTLPSTTANGSKIVNDAQYLPSFYSGSTTPAASSNQPSFTVTGLVNLTVTKNITGVVASLITSSLSFPFTVSCGNPTATYSGSVTVLAGSLTGSTSISLPIGSTGCTLAEESATLPTTPTNYAWGTPSYSTLSNPISTDTSGTINNPLARIQISVTINKTVTGAPTAGAPGDYGFSLDCDTGTYTGTVAIASGSTGSTTVNVPQGATCTTLSETSKASAPANFSWGAETTTPPTGTIASGASGSIVNPLTPPRNPPSISKTARIVDANVIEWTITVVNNLAANAGGPPIVVNVSDVFPAGLTATAGSVTCTPTTTSGLTTVTGCGFSADNLSLTATTALAYTSDATAATASERVDIVFRGKVATGVLTTNQACASVAGAADNPVCGQVTITVPPGSSTAIPTLDGRALTILSLLILGLASWLMRRRR